MSFWHSTTALGRVPTIDATGLVALESAIGRLRRARKEVIVAGPLPRPGRVFDRAGWTAVVGDVVLADTLEDALPEADVLAGHGGEATTRSTASTARFDPRAPAVTAAAVGPVDPRAAKCEPFHRALCAGAKSRTRARAHSVTFRNPGATFES